MSNYADTAVPFLLAQAAAIPFSWQQTLLVYGPLGLWVAWFVIRDRLDRDERKQERLDQERRHAENITSARRLEDALRTNTNSMIIGIAALKTIDAGYAALLATAKAHNDESSK